MSGQHPAVNGAGVPRVVLLDDGKPHDVFDVIGVAEGIVRMRSPGERYGLLALAQITDVANQLTSSLVAHSQSNPR